MHGLHRAAVDEGLRLSREAAQASEVEWAALPCWSDASQHAARHPLAGMLVQLGPLGRRRSLYVSGFGSRHIVWEGPITSFLKQ